MMNFRVYFTAALLGAATTCFAVTAYEQQAIKITSGTVTGMEEILEAIPTMDTKTSKKAAADLVKMGPEGVAQLVGMLTVEPNDQNTSARYALNLLAHETMRPGAAREKKAYADAIAKALEETLEVELKRLFIQLLWMVGEPDVLPVLAKYSVHETLAPLTVKAMLVIGGPAAAEHFVAQLPNAQGITLAALLKAIGESQNAKSAPEVVKYVEDSDAQVREAALYALGQLGNPAGRPAVEKALDVEQPLLRARAYSWYLLMARKIAAAGDKQQGVEMAKLVIEKTKDQMPMAGFTAEALSTLATIQGKAAMPDLLAALESNSSEVRMAALNQLNKLKGQDVTSALTRSIDKATSEGKVEILYTLGRRGDRAALTAITNNFQAEDPAIRIEAVKAAYLVGRERVAERLLTFLNSAQDEKEAAAASEALGRMKGDQALAQMAKALPNASKEGKIALLKVLAARRATAQKEAAFAQTSDEQRAVRVAAVNALSDLAGPADMPRLIELLLKAQGEQEQTAVENAIAAVAKQTEDEQKRVADIVAAYQSASPENKGKLMQAITRIGGKAATDLALSETKNPDAAIRSAAIRGLSNSTDSAVAPELLRLAREAGEETNKVLALRGYIRLAAESKSPQPEKLKMYKQALELAKGAEEKRQILARLGDIKNPASLELAAPLLDDAEVQKDAAQAVATITMPVGKREGIMTFEAAAALTKASRLVDDEKLRKRMEQQVGKIDLAIEEQYPQADADGFVPLFNGKNLDGWTGAVAGYKVEKGVLVCPANAGGQLYTEREYGDFVFQFDFKLEAGSNNGVALRAPIGGDAAYVGMESQILDDTAPKYKDLKPYQFHGSIYGIAPAQTGHLKPVGEWNSEEITLKGTKVTVRLNGTTIVDYDLAEAIQSGKTMDGKQHPGINRTSGHIGFLGHGSRVEFRNIRVKEIVNEAPEGFTALFNGKDLSGWKGLVANPLKRAQMNPEQLAQEQQKADEQMRQHWTVKNGTLLFDGEGSHLCTVKDYGDFEMLVDWKIGPGGDSGIYLRGSPQVQIWDPEQNPVGSGGLYNNQKGTSTPLVKADNPVRSWNTFRIKMVGDKVTVHLNGKLVVDNVPLENYWDRKQPIFPTGQLELQSHGSALFFRNVFVKDLTGQAPADQPAADDKSTAPEAAAAANGKNGTNKENSELVLTSECYSLNKLFREKKITVEEVPAILKDLGYSGISWNDMYFTSWEPEYLQKLNKAAADAGITPVCLIMEGNLATDNEEARKKQIESNAMKLRAAKTLGVSVVRMNLGRTENEDDNGTVGVERSIAAFKELLPLAKELGIKITIENHGGPSKKADWILRIINETDPEYVGSCLDFGNWPAEPAETRYEETQKLAKHAYHVHVKTYAFGPDGEDTRVDFARMFDMMKKAGYKGGVSVEWEGKEPEPIEALKLSKALIQKHWPEVK